MASSASASSSAAAAASGLLPHPASSSSSGSSSSSAAASFFAPSASMRAFYATLRRRPQPLLALLLLAVGLVYFSGLAGVDRRRLSASDALAGQALSSCTPPTGRPAEQYALMLDAGSTGSRIHVYRFRYCAGSAAPVLVGEEFHQVKPGLSAYGDSPAEAARSVDSLLAHALAAVPETLHSCTPVAVKATAGLRLLGPEKSQAILDAVSDHLHEDYPFHVAGSDGVAVMDGEDEGVFAWITVNYLLERIGGAERRPTAAIMDLGGGSTQIVFEPVSSDVILANNHRTEISFGGHHYALYQHSYLGYGLMEARRRLGEAAVAEADARRLRAAADASQPAASLAPTLPCLPAGATLADPSTSRPAGSAGRASEEHAGGAAGAVVRGTGAGFAACAQFVTRHLFDKSDAACTVAPCAWDGVHQPRLASAFPPGRDIYAFSYIYDRAVELGGAAEGDRDSGDGALVLTPDALRALGERVCSVDSVPAVPAAAAANDVAGGPAHLARAVSADPALCLDVGFIYHLLSTGYEIPGSRVLRTAKKIRGVETGWCLGAAIHMLDSMMAGSAGAKGVCRHA